MNIFIFIQARLGSTRLPGKVLLEIDEKPLLWYLINRLYGLKHKVQLLVATTNAERDKTIIEFCEKNKIHSFAGDENDVLDRFYQASKKVKADVIIRVTGDCPLIDPEVIDNGLDIFLANKYDFVCNTQPPTYPDGLDVEIFSFSVLERSWKEAKLQSEREHVTPFIYKNPTIFKLFCFKCEIDYSSYRLTVDVKQDFELIAQIIAHFKTNWQKIHFKEIISYLESNKKLMDLNKDFQRNEGYTKSLKEDKKNG